MLDFAVVFVLRGCFVVVVTFVDAVVIVVHFTPAFSTTRFICAVPLLKYSMNANIFGSQHRVVC